MTRAAGTSCLRRVILGVLAILIPAILLSACNAVTVTVNPAGKPSVSTEKVTITDYDTLTVPPVTLTVPTLINFQTLTTTRTLTATINAEGSIPGVTPEIAVTYSASTTIGLGDSQAPIMASAGRVFFIVSVRIENKGYGYFSTEPAMFRLVINGRTYSPVVISSLSGMLPNKSLVNGESAAGNIIFAVRAEDAGSSYELSNSWTNQYRFKWTRI